MKSTETNILGASKELKEIVIESGHMAESLFERVNTGYDELKVCICYVVLSIHEQDSLLDNAPNYLSSWVFYPKEINSKFIFLGRN